MADCDCDCSGCDGCGDDCCQCSDCCDCGDCHCTDCDTLGQICCLCCYTPSNDCCLYGVSSLPSRPSVTNVPSLSERVSNWDRIRNSTPSAPPVTTQPTKRDEEYVIEDLPPSYQEATGHGSVIAEKDIDVGT